jgi:hypothetical protein
MKDLISGARHFIPCHQVRQLYVPQYDTLKIELILEKVMTIPEAVIHLPDAKEICKCPKQWLVNIIYSVVGEDFADWVKQRIKERNDKVTVLRDLNISIHPEVLAAFQSSNAVSM